MSSPCSATRCSKGVHTPWPQERQIKYIDSSWRWCHCNKTRRWGCTWRSHWRWLAFIACYLYLQGLKLADMSVDLPASIPRISWEDEPRQLIQTALSMARAGKAPSLDVPHCIKIIPPTTFLHLLWSELASFSSVGETEISRRIATFVLAMPRSLSMPPLLPIFLHVVMPSIIFAMDHQKTPDHALKVDLLVTIISSALTSALHLELGIRSVTGEHQFVLGQSSSGMARKLAADLRARRNHTSREVLQKLASSQSFAANFAVSINDLGWLQTYNDDNNYPVIKKQFSAVTLQLEAELEQI